MKVFIVSDVQDTGGQGVRIKEALEREGWQVRSMAPPTWINYPADLPFRKKSAEEMYQWCDVIHVRNSFTLYDQLAEKYGPKPVVVSYHGTKFRGNPNYYLREQSRRGAIGMASTLDLWLLSPDDLEWLPAPYDC